MSTATTASGQALTPTDLGVGARFSLHPATGGLVDVAAAADRSGLEVTVDDLSTLVRGTESDVLLFVHHVVAAGARVAGHVVAHVQLSRGCPGEVACGLADHAVLADVEPPELPATGLRAAAHWALYPLDDGRVGHPGDHMRAIEQAVAVARTRATVSPEHFVTRLDGDLAEVLGAVAAGWLAAGRHVRHVVAHAVVSVTSTPAGN
ncbi:YkoF family thiamine/hydroxymethylpyrimidine-binding protein [Cellulomonas sp. URHB0016]